jgi:MOSC domain-containing protein YiiM
VDHLKLAELEIGLDEIRSSPLDRGSVEMIVRRPAEGEREVLAEGVLDTAVGLVGDRWRLSQGDDPDVRTQVTLMNARAAALIAIEAERRPLAGDQIYVDLNLGLDNVPAGTRLRIGEAVIEVSEVPHTGCGKFIKRFGIDAQKFVNSPAGRQLNLRGINAQVIVGGVVRPGDEVVKLNGDAGAAAA